MGFTPSQVTQAINAVPSQYGRIGAMGLFAPKPGFDKYARIEFKNGKLELIKSQSRGTRGDNKETERRNVHTLEVPYFPKSGTVLPSDIAGKRAFGSNASYASMNEALNDKLVELKKDHDTTHEYMRLGALKGQVLDADGSVILDLYSEFSISQDTIDFDFTTADFDPTEKTMDLANRIRTRAAAVGVLVTEVVAEVGFGFFKKLRANSYVQKDMEVRKVSSNENTQQLTFAGVTFKVSYDQALNASGTLTNFVDTDEGIAFPIAPQTSGLYVEAMAPAEMTSAVNTRAMKIYASVKELDHEGGYDIHTESNFLPICTQPTVLVNLTHS